MLSTGTLLSHIYRVIQKCWIHKKHIEIANADKNRVCCFKESVIRFCLVPKYDLMCAGAPLVARTHQANSQL